MDTLSQGCHIGLCRLCTAQPSTPKGYRYTDVFMTRISQQMAVELRMECIFPICTKESSCPGFGEMDGSEKGAVPQEGRDGESTR